MIDLNTFPARRKKPSKISKLYVFIYLSRRRAWLIASFSLAATLFIVSLALTLISPVGDLPYWLVLVSWSATTISVIVSVHEILSKWKMLNAPGIVPEFAKDAFEDFLEHVSLPQELLKSGYKVVRGGVGKNILNDYQFTGASAVSHQVNRKLWGMLTSEFIATVPTECFTLLRKYKKWTWPSRQDSVVYPTVKILSLSRSLENESKVRLRVDLHATDSFGNLVIEKSDYLSDLVTGQLTGISFKDSLGYPVYNGYELAYELKSGKWELKPCLDSACSNQLGVSSLLIDVSSLENCANNSLKGQFHIVRQAIKNVQSSDLLAPSGSGSLDWSDYIDYGNSFVHTGMMRELLEETTKSDWCKLGKQASVVLTGFSRMLHRGGKPEFYGLVIMPGSNHKLGIDETETEFVKSFETVEVNPLSAQNLRTSLVKYATDNQAQLSHPLFLTLRFASEYLEERATEFNAYLENTYKGRKTADQPAQADG